MTRFKSFFSRTALLVAAIFLSNVALAGTVTVQWSAASDPAVGWNLYMNHLQTPDALQYLGTTNANQRSTVFHNVESSGVYQFGISRVERVWDGSVYRRIEGNVSVITIHNGAVITTPDGVTLTSIVFDPNG